MTNVDILCLFTQTKKQGGNIMMERNERARQDAQNEGRDEYYLDIDRMINEGMSGGYVHGRGDAVNIEEARDLVKEEPPHQTT
jgi:hypothetical protein